MESQGPSLRSLLSLQMLSSPCPCVRWGVPIASQSCLISLHQCVKLCQANVNHNSESSGLRTGANRSLKIFKRDMETQDIDNLDVPELTQLEKELDAVLRQTRSIKEKQMKEEKVRLENEIAALKLKEQQSKDRAADEEADRQSTSAANNTTTTTNNSRSSEDYVPATILQLF
nr:uncharacterized protein LOC114826851 isoform X2 [Malus domestica]